VEQLICRA